MLPKPLADKILPAWPLFGIVIDPVVIKPAADTPPVTVRLPAVSNVEVFPLLLILMALVL